MEPTGSGTGAGDSFRGRLRALWLDLLVLVLLLPDPAARRWRLFDSLGEAY